MKAFFDSTKHPKATIVVKGTKQSGTLEAILDTGFDGHLSLPLATAVPLGLELIGVERVRYADGRVSQELVFSVSLELDGKETIIPATITAGSVALIGTSLLNDYEVTFNFANLSITTTKVRK